MSNSRKFYDDLFSYYTSNDNAKFYSYFDQHSEWKINGEHIFAGTYKNLDLVKASFQRFYQMLGLSPKSHLKQNLKYLLVEGNKAAAFLYDEILAKDGKKYIVDYSLVLEHSKEGKITKVDMIIDALQLDKISKVCATKPRKSA
jgi:ketosteroid isomerase-like protein